MLDKLEIPLNINSGQVYFRVFSKYCQGEKSKFREMEV